MQEASQLKTLVVRLQSSMSEEHPPSPTKLISDHDTFSGVSSSLEGSKMITYRPLKSVGGSENSQESDKQTGEVNDSGSSGNENSKSPRKQMNSGLYRYVMSTGAHQIETFDEKVSSAKIGCPN